MNKKLLAAIPAVLIISLIPVYIYGAFGSGAQIDPNLFTDIAVQFRTPPYVALDLMGEDTNQRGHEAFFEQLKALEGHEQVEIYSEHYRLFSGVFISVPNEMVHLIKDLPEVYLVSLSPAISVGLPLEPIDVVVQFGSYEAYEEIPRQPLMREVMELLDIDYIHNSLNLSGAGVQVAVLDSGIDYTHPRFSDFLYEGAVRGWDFIDDSDSPMEALPNNPNGATSHGTRVTGAIAAISPNVELWHYRVTDSLGGREATLLAGLEKAHEDGADIINISLGVLENDPSLPISAAANVAAASGTIIIVAAGNNDTGAQLAAPAAANLPITVGAGNITGDRVANFSSAGPAGELFYIKPDIIAPGEGVLTTFPTFSGNPYGFMNGTSIAAPIVTGIAALMLEALPDATSHEIKARLMNTAMPVSASVFSAGAGLVQPLRALTQEPYATVRSSQADSYEIMASLNFGITSREVFSRSLSVTIHNPGEGTWEYEVFFNGIESAEALVLEDYADNEFTFRMDFENSRPGSIYEGNIVFTDSTSRITLPFAAWLH